MYVRLLAGAVDTESLVVQAGRWVWTVRVDVHVLDHGGNLAGAASIAVRARAFQMWPARARRARDNAAILHPCRRWRHCSRSGGRK